MRLSNPFRRNRTHGADETSRMMPDPWWAWGPLGLIWYGGHAHDGSRNHDAGQLNHPGDVGHFNNHMDSGGGFDGGGAGGI